MAEFAARYARAFAGVAESSGIDSAAAQGQMHDFAETLSGSLELREYLGNPSVAMSQKMKVVDAIAGRLGMDGKVRNFIAVILEHHRLGEFDEILAAYAGVADEHAGAAEAQITSARAMNAEDRALLEAQIAKLAGAQVRATYFEDASLIGGAVVQIGSTVYDGSVKAQLQQLKRSLVHA